MNNKNINVNMDIKYALGKSLDASITKSADLSTKYKLNKDPIGKGAFSTVYYARNNKLDEFAIKRILLSELKEARIDKFHLELNISLTLDHPNIVKCYETFETPTSWYIVTEYCRGGTLFEVLHRKLNVIIPWKQRIKIARDIALGMNYLHSLTPQIIHRDLKSLKFYCVHYLSLMFEEPFETDGKFNIKIVDFGLSRFQEDHDSTKLTGLMGTFVFYNFG